MKMDRFSRGFCELIREHARFFGLRPFRTIHIQRQSNHERVYCVFFDSVNRFCELPIRLRFVNGSDGSCDARLRVSHRKTDAFLAVIDSEVSHDSIVDWRLKIVDCERVANFQLPN